jgi:putative transposase
MPRIGRIAPDGVVHHVLNRGNARGTLFHNSNDYKHFLYLLAEAAERIEMRVLGFCLMRNHWHLVLWPHRGSDLSAYMQWLTNAHVRHFQALNGTAGLGHLYQGRFKNFIIQDDRHLLTVLRYVEANALRARLVSRAEDWPWTSASCQLAPDGRPLLSPWPVPRPRDWRVFLNELPAKEQLRRLRCSVTRGAPFGDDGWVKLTARQLGLVPTIQARGRPRKGDSHLFTLDVKR